MRTTARLFLATAACATLPLGLAACSGSDDTADTETTATATVHLDMDKGAAVTEIALVVTAKVANPDEARFQAEAQKAKEKCPMSRLLAPGTNITLDASLA